MRGPDEHPGYAEAYTSHVATLPPDERAEWVRLGVEKPDQPDYKSRGVASAALAELRISQRQEIKTTPGDSGLEGVFRQRISAWLAGNQGVSTLAADLADAALDHCGEKSAADGMALFLEDILGWLAWGESTRTGPETLGRRAFDLIWCLQPRLLDHSTLLAMEEVLGCSRQNLSALAVDFRRMFLGNDTSIITRTLIDRMGRAKSKGADSALYNAARNLRSARNHLLQALEHGLDAGQAEQLLAHHDRHLQAGIRARRKAHDELEGR